VAKKEIPVKFVIPIAVLAVALIAYFGYVTLAGPSRAEVPTAKEMHSKAEKLALKSGGDFSALTPAEQKMLDEMTLGHGKRYIEINYKRLSGGNKP